MPLESTWHLHTVVPWAPTGGTTLVHLPRSMGSGVADERWNVWARFDRSLRLTGKVDMEWIFWGSVHPTSFPHPHNGRWDFPYTI